eukprot:TRINITY_DN23749_c0_g1_i1.p1 TRINITY_DN23749_c0_g1~~TRINITY_DN23749_c0_g1_i1.p1  ORF type:complete len:236 (+),score=35.34 TRINITY_DN23749_c0_g1_i1:301-1008(+)
MGDLGKANILCFHGYMQNAELFRSRIGSIRKALKSKAEFHFLNAPFLADSSTFENGSSDEDRGEGRSWFQWQDVDPGTRPSRATKYSGWETSKQLMLDQFQSSSPVHGLIGFSQGATSVGMFLSQGVEEGWLEKVAPDLKFVVLIAGFAPKDESFLEIIQRANICIPSLHVYGESDELVSNERSLQLGQCFDPDQKQIFVHSGGHMVPTCSGQFKQILLTFINGNGVGMQSGSSG